MTPQPQKHCWEEAAGCFCGGVANLSSTELHYTEQNIGQILRGSGPHFSRGNSSPTALAEGLCVGVLRRVKAKQARPHPILFKRPVATAIWGAA